MISAAEKQKRREAVEWGNAINSIEGVPLSEEMNGWVQEWVNGEISHEVLAQRVINKHRRAE